jgi:hypothetical protein
LDENDLVRLAYEFWHPTGCGGEAMAPRLIFTNKAKDRHIMIPQARQLVLDRINGNSD